MFSVLQKPLVGSHMGNVIFHVPVVAGFTSSAIEIVTDERETRVFAIPASYVQWVAGNVNVVASVEQVLLHADISHTVGPFQLV